MKQARRDFLRTTGRLAAISAAAVPAVGCIELGELALHKDNSNDSDATPTDPRAISALPPSDQTIHTLKRLSFGIAEADLQHTENIGLEAYIEEQLDPEEISDPTDAEVAKRYPTTQMSGPDLKKETSGYIRRQLRDATLYRACYSHRQLLEVMVDFWTNHFNVDNRLSRVNRYKAIDDRDVIRAHALGNFRDLLHASAKSPAMLVYLDNESNTKEGPNENYARELMELHTLGIEGGYNEEDIKEVARCFTGWAVNHNEIRFQFDPTRHDTDEKNVLGHYIQPDQGVEDGKQVLDILAAHPSTARFLAEKLVKRFVSDNPPPLLVDVVASTYTRTDGDIREMLRTLLTSEEFISAQDAKLKRPMEYICSAMRIMAPDPESFIGSTIYNALKEMGQAPFEHPTPDGYPDEAADWISTQGLSARWNFAATLAEGKRYKNSSYLQALTSDAETATELVDQLTDGILHRPLHRQDRDQLIELAAGGEDPDQSLAIKTKAKMVEPIASLLLSSPYFMAR